MAAHSQRATALAPQTLSLPFDPGSARLAREELAAWLQACRPSAELTEDARLVISELVGNAVRHARPLPDSTMKVTWRCAPEGLDISVTDGGAATVPQRLDAGLSDLAGRGLAIVEALAERWWIEAKKSGTTVHALLPHC